MATVDWALAPLKEAANNNVGIDFDLVYGWQCVDGSNSVYNRATGKALWGNAIDLLNSAAAQGETVIYEAQGVIAKKGDIFVMEVPGSPYGHTGVVIEDSDGYTLKTIEQNVDGNVDYLEVGGPARYRTRSYAGMVGYIRPHYDDVEEIVAVAKGWVEDSTGWYYRDEDGNYPKSKWEQINGGWFYFNTNGYALRNQWFQDDDESWYWFKDSCHMATGWEKVGDYWYYFGNDGRMKTGWIQYFDKWYYCEVSSGKMVSQEVRQVDGKWYYFNAKGEMLNRAAVYVDESGAMHFSE